MGKNMNSIEALNKLRQLNKTGDKKIYFDAIEQDIKERSKKAKTELESLGWNYDKDLLLWVNQEQRHIDLSDFPYIEMFYWNGEEKVRTYLSVEEIGLLADFCKGVFDEI